jgi:hypothetical protein
VANVNCPDSTLIVLLIASFSVLLDFLVRCSCNNLEILVEFPRARAKSSPRIQQAIKVNGKFFEALNKYEESARKKSQLSK